MADALTGKIALVSGASRGLGRAIALELGSAGAHVICTGRSTAAGMTQDKVPGLTIDATADAVRSAGGSVEAVRCDHTDPAQVAALIGDIADRHGRLDILVNNAWGGHDFHDETVGGDEVWDEPMDQFRQMLLAGAYSDFVTSLTALRQLMGPAGSGIIVTTTWHTPEPPAWVPYESSKAAKNRLVYALGHHLREKGIPAIAVAPGWMRTELMLTHHTEEELAGKTETPHFAARAVVALAGDPDAIRFTGQTVDVWDLSQEYGFTGLDGTQPHCNAGRYR
jgi:NAD(P)-dependent dehydrogenase (short-subunit alcohol dehydrogenase family)